MPQINCPACHTEIDSKSNFCSNCGYDLRTSIVCPNCQYSNELNSKFCQECGTPLQNQASTNAKTKGRANSSQSVVDELEPPPNKGITIEFPYSSAQSFEFAVHAAKQLPSFKQYGQEKKAIYRVTLRPADIHLAAELLEHLKGWRKRAVYVNGEKETWDSVFAFSWCYEKKKSSFKPDVYCFGYENDWEFNVWGCIQAHLPFTEHSEWFTWGKWLNDRGDWQFDKARIQHELQKALYPFRFCPALQPDLIQDVIRNLPDIVNPNKDKNWKFVERWGDESSPGLVVITNRYGFQEKVVMRGVCPNGTGAFKELAKRLKNRLPNHR